MRSSIKLIDNSVAVYVYVWKWIAYLEIDENWITIWKSQSVFPLKLLLIIPINFIAYFTYDFFLSIFGFKWLPDWVEQITAFKTEKNAFNCNVVIVTWIMYHGIAFLWKYQLVSGLQLTDIVKNSNKNVCVFIPELKRLLNSIRAKSSWIKNLLWLIDWIGFNLLS